MAATPAMNAVRIGYSQATDDHQAVAQLAEQIAQPDAELVLFFSTSLHDPDRLATAMRNRFPGITAGCTTAGEIGPRGYTKSSLVGVSFGPGPIHLHHFSFSSISSLSLEAVAACHRLFEERRVYPQGHLERDCLGMLLADGLSLREEHLIAALSSRFQPMSIVGGSAGDDHQLQRTSVFLDGEKLDNGAVFLVFEMGGVPFQTIRFQDVVPISEHMVITGADAEDRIIHEIECEPAVSVYERVVGIPRERLTPDLIGSHSLMVQLGGEEYVRGVRSIEPDGSLRLHAAIDEGVVIRFGRPDDTLSSLSRFLEAGSAPLASTSLAVCFDCLHRRLELTRQGQLERAGELITRLPAVGFSTYGEIIHSVHVNQTMTGVLFGWREPLRSA